MIDVVVTQRVNAGMVASFEALAREVTANTLSQDKGCFRYEWYPCRRTANLHPD
jgi:quinol monooxygenase YgiN